MKSISFLLVPILFAILLVPLMGVAHADWSAVKENNLNKYGYGPAMIDSNNRIIYTLGNDDIIFDIYDTDGRLISSVPYSDDRLVPYDDEFRLEHTVSNKDRIYVVNDETNIIYAYDTPYDNLLSNPALIVNHFLLGHVTSLTVDSNDNVLVSDIGGPYVYQGTVHSSGVLSTIRVFDSDSVDSRWESTSSYTF